MNKVHCIWLLGCLAATAWGNTTPLGNVVAQQAQTALHQHTNAGWNRFQYMRFYLPSNEVPQEPGFWERLFSSSADKTHTRALAIYLFNMHASVQTLHEQRPQLSLNYLGVLDGVTKAAPAFDTTHAQAFYQKHQKEIISLMNQFVAKSNPAWAAPTQAQYQAWLELLEKQPRRNQKPVYSFPLSDGLQSELPSTLAKWGQQTLRMAQQQAQQQVITYDQADVNLENFDRKIGNARAYRKLTYRWVREECHYSSYLLGRLVVNAVTQKTLPWNTRIYLLTAYPKQGEFLTPATGNRFILADTQPGLHWRYHTALLLIIPHQGTYVPLVLDLFLGGLTPLTLDQWLAHFQSNTVFTATPFTRDKATENALKTPQRLEGNTVWVDNKKYQPANIEK